MKNYKLKRTKKMLLILLCFLEVFIALGVSTVMVNGTVGSKPSNYSHTYVLQPFIHAFESSISARYRLSSGIYISFMIAMVDIISLVTVCLIECYAYYPSKYKHPVRYGFIRLGVKLSVVMLFSCITQLVLLQRVIVAPLLVYEYIRLARLSRRLHLLLYQRYFDARFHEYQNARIYLYYKQVYVEFSIGSALVLTSLFFHIFTTIIMSLYPIVLTILTTPKWFNRVYSIPVTEEYFVAFNNWDLSSFSQVMVILVNSSVGIGTFIITFPYLLVTLVFFCKLFKRIVQSFPAYSGYSFRPDLIKEMIERNNSAYGRYY